MPTQKLLTKESSKALLAMLKHSYFKNVRNDIKQIWARSRNSEDTANEWLLKYHPLIVECEKLAIEPKVCARMCYIKYHKENPYTKHLNKNNDVSLNTLKKEALQYFEGLKKWKEDSKEFNKEIEEFMKNEKVTADTLKYTGKDIEKYILKPLGIKYKDLNYDNGLYLEYNPNKNYSEFDTKNLWFSKYKNLIHIGFCGVDGIAFFSKTDKEGMGIKNEKEWADFKSLEDTKKMVRE